MLPVLPWAEISPFQLNGESSPRGGCRNVRHRPEFVSGDVSGRFDLPLRSDNGTVAEYYAGPVMLGTEASRRNGLWRIRACSRL